MEHPGGSAAHDEGRFFDDVVTDIDHEVGDLEGAMEKVVIGYRRATDEQRRGFIDHPFAHLRRNKRYLPPLD